MHILLRVKISLIDISILPSIAVVDVLMMLFIIALYGVKRTVSLLGMITLGVFKVDFECYK